MKKKTNKTFPAELFDLVPLILSLVNKTFFLVRLHEGEHFQVSDEERDSHFTAVSNITETSTWLTSWKLIKYIRPPRKIKCYHRKHQFAWPRKREEYSKKKKSIK